MQQLLQGGFQYESLSSPGWEGSRSNKFNLRQRQHFLISSHFPQSMVPKLSDHFTHKERKHGTPQKSPERAHRLSDYFELYKPKELPRLQEYTNKATMPSRGKRLNSTSSKNSRSVSVHPDVRPSQMSSSMTKNILMSPGIVSARKAISLPLKSLSLPKKLPPCYEMVDYHDLYLQNKRSLKRDEERSLKELLERPRV